MGRKTAGNNKSGGRGDAERLARLAETGERGEEEERRKDNALVA